MIFDLETHLIKPGTCFPRIVCGAFESSFGPEHTTLVDRPTVIEFVARDLAHGNALAGHNVAFDLGCTLAAEPSLAGAIFDHYRRDLVRCTMVRGWLLDTARGCLGKLGGYDLSRLHDRAGFGPLDKGADTWRLRYAELDGMPLDRWPEAARVYPLEDVHATRRLFDVQAEQDPGPDEWRQARASFALALTAGWGLVTDPVKVDAFEFRYRTELTALEAALQACSVVRPNGSQDMKRTAEIVSHAYGGNPPRTEKGNVKADKLTCKEAPNQTPAIIALGRIGSVSHQLDKNLPMLRRGLIHTHFTMAETGRVKSGGGDGNTTNLDKKGGMRECFVPRPGFVFASVDYSTIELCTLAQVELDLFGSSEMADVINRGEDLHTSLACTILGINYTRGVALHAALDPAFEDARQAAKVANFGFPGGLGAVAFCAFALAQYNVRVTEEQARDLKRAWLRRWRLERYFRHVDALVNAGGVIVHPRSGRVRGRVGYTDGCNGFFQALAADAAKGALFEVVAATFTPGSPLYGSHVVNFVHDSIDTESPEWCAAEAAEEQSKIMVREAKKWIPDVRVSAAPLLARYMSKDAKPVRDGAGRLVPWAA